MLECKQEKCGWMDTNGQRVITIAHRALHAQVSYKPFCKIQNILEPFCEKMYPYFLFPNGKVMNQKFGTSIQADRKLFLLLKYLNRSK